MGVVELEVCDEQVGFGHIDGAAAFAPVEDQVIDVEGGDEEAFGLAIEVLAE